MFKNFSFRNSIFFKIFVIVIIMLLLLIPTSMITSLIMERENTQTLAIEEVSSKWGAKQTITGPLLTIPYLKYVKQTGKNDTILRTILVREYVHILPSVLKINGDVKPEKRNRGIYEIVVYNSKLNITGTFSKIDLKSLDVQTTSMEWEKAEFVVGINDLRGIEKQIELNWNNKTYSFNSGVTSNDVVASGINANIKINANDSSQYDFNLTIDLKGSQLLYFTPVGKVTDVNLNSPWPNPSFNGSFIPDSREVSETGFKAHWNVLHLNRNYPQQWTSSNLQAVQESSFGTDLLLPVDSYQKSYRSIKYAILFICLTFLVFFFIEVLNKVFIHPIQYILVGIALIVFYTLLLAISEHIKFNYAFIISALATLVLIASYVKAILKSNRLVILISGMLLILYTFIFVVIQLQDYALLIGSIGIFIILALVMYYSRKIDWFNLKLDNPQ